MKVAIVGPPHSGKTVFLGGLCENLPRDKRFLFRACPDGEGTWTWRSSEAAKCRRKGFFNPRIVDWYVEKLRTNKLAPIVLVDVGGKITSENHRILSEVDAVVIISGALDAIGEWEDFSKDCGCEILARIHSDYHASEDDPMSDPMVVHHLERGEDVSCRPTIQRVAEIILSRIQDAVKNDKEEDNMLFKDNILSINTLAENLGKEKVTRTLPNGRVVEQIVWEGSDLADISRLLHNASGEMPEVVKIDGPAPAWLVAALVHECHPRYCMVNSPDGFVPIGCQRPEGNGSGENLEFSLETREDGWVVVTCQQADPSIPLSPEKLGEVTPPEVPMGTKIVLSGRMPNWLAASLAMAYHGRAKAVALFQPGIGATVTWTHSQEVKLGSVV
jgi:CRISPR-associated Csx3 family protein